MTAGLVALALFLAVLAVRPRRPDVARFLAPDRPAPPAPKRRVRVGAGALAGTVAGAVAAAALDTDVATAILAGLLSGALGQRMVTSARRRRRSARLALELPAVADAIALHVLAGDTVSGALHRFAAEAAGVAADEIRVALADPSESLDMALRRAAAGTANPDATRLYDLLAHTHRTGGPLVDALGALAADYRAATAAALTAEGGRRSLAVYAPILALMVPVTLVFLMYPTLAGLHALSGP